jgi:IS605 OrfB family transposase
MDDNLQDLQHRMAVLMDRMYLKGKADAYRDCASRSSSQGSPRLQSWEELRLLLKNAKKDLTTSSRLTTIINMKLTVQIKLQPSQEQFEWLKETMRKFNEACDYISVAARQNGCTSKYALQKLVYYDVKSRFGLTAQMVIRAISKVIEAYKRDRTKLCQFKPFGAVTYDQRILRLKGLDTANLWTVQGRQNIPFVVGEYQKQHLPRVKGQADLVLVDGSFYLLAVVDVPEPPKRMTKDVIGIDLGIVQIATDSTGEQFSGATVENERQRISGHRQRLQKRGTRSAKRRLKKVARKESRFRRDVNHCISKKLVEKAKDSDSAIALEDLKGIRKRTTVRKSQRAKHSGWSFSQLREFISYKAALNGIPVFVVDPRNTSRECSCCGFVSEANRKSQSEFACVSCGHSENADINAAKNIASRAAVRLPIVAFAQANSYKPTTSVVGF